MFRVRQNIIQKIICIVFFEIIFLFMFSGCSKDNGTKIITSLPPVSTYNNMPVGVSAHDLLSADKYNDVEIEIQYVEGFQPQGESINNLLIYLNNLITKNGGIRYSMKSIRSPLKNNLTLNDIATIEKDNRTVFSSASGLGVYILFIDGYYSQGNMIGLSYRNTSICLFGKTIFENSGRIGQPAKTTLESSVMQHEFAHLLGLVDMGSPMQTDHKDATHNNHCNNSACLMSYAFESTEFLKYLSPNTIPALDANCKADLKANGGK